MLDDDFHIFVILWMVAKSESPVENGGKHPIIYRVSTILLVVQDFATTHCSNVQQDQPVREDWTSDHSVMFILETTGNGFVFYLFGGC